ncbi:MAG: ornithine cyclodeaminase family protein [Chloroflexi bacterium]|nr:ornithine cyclodeaminase family protein [Chloroflexota bacterium]
MALLLNRADVQRLLTMRDAIEVVEGAFSELAAGTATMPDRTVIVDPDVGGWIGFMPAYLKSSGAVGVKAVTVYKDNPKKFNLATTLGTIILLDQKTGKAVSVMDAGLLTAMRTGAVSGVATKHLARKDAKVAGVLGSGVQARTQVLGMCAVRKFESVLVFSVDPPEKQKAFAEGVAKDANVKVEIAKSAEELVRRSDVLALATTAANPIVDGDWLKLGAHINGIGSHAPGVRELDLKTIKRAKVICDSRKACLNEAGDLIIPIRNGEYEAEQIHGDLGDVINGKAKGRTSDTEITVFKSVGLAIQDMSCASLVYRKAREAKVGVDFEFG